MYEMPRGCELMKALKISTNLEIEAVELSEPLYKSIRNELGGYLEVVRPMKLVRPFCMIVDEEGLLKNLPLNPLGCWLYGTEEHLQPIVGDIIIMAEMDSIDGIIFKGLTDTQIESLTNDLTEFIQTYKEIELYHMEVSK